MRNPLKWDGEKVSVRDKVDSSFDLSFHSTQDIIDFLEKIFRLPETRRSNFDQTKIFDFQSLVAVEEIDPF